MTISRNLSFLAEGVSSTGVLGVSNGGSGATTLSGYLYGNGTGAFTASTTIPTSSLSGTISNAQLANSSLTVNGTSISLGGSGTVTAAAGTLTGTTLNSTVVSSSLTSVGTLTSGTWNASTIGATYGGTGQNTVTTGDLLYGSASNTWSKLGIGSTGTILRVVGGVPTWGTDYTGTVTSVAASVPSFLSISGSPITTSGTLAITYSGTALPTANGGTALTSFTNNGILYASSTSALSTTSTFTFDGNNLSIGSGNIYLRSASSGTKSLISVGRTAQELIIGIASGSSSIITGDAAGDVDFQATSGAFNWSVNNGSTLNMKLNTSGYLGIGTNPNSFFHVKGGNNNVANIDNAGAQYTNLAFSNNGTEKSAIYWDNNNSLFYFTAEAANSQMVFATNGSERARIDSNGNLLLNTTSQFSSSKLTVYSSGIGIASKVTGTSNQTIFGMYIVKPDNDTTTSQRFIGFGINNDAAGSGQINANGANSAAFGSYSDARLKENIVDLPTQLNNILALKPKEFDYISSEGGGHQIGFIAQDMQEVYPDVVGEDENGMLTITGWSKTEARIVKAIQELSIQINDLQNKLKTANITGF